MNTRPTWWLTGIALAMALYIFFVERGGNPPKDAVRSTALLPDLKREQVSTIEITQTNQPLIRLRKSGSLWNLEAPLHYPAQIVAAERWLQLLEQAQWVVRMPPEELLSRESAVADFGLAPPMVTVKLQHGDQTSLIRIGHRLAVGRQIYVQIDDAPDVLVTDNQLLEQLPLTSLAWRDTALVTFTSMAVSNKIAFDRVEVRPATNGYTLQPDPASGWRVIRPVSARGDAARITQFVYGVLPFWQVQEFVTDDPAADLTPFGLQTPLQELVIGRGTNDMLVVQFGGSPTNRPELVYARLLRHTNIVLTARTNLDWLRLPYTLWRDRLLVKLDTNRITEIVGDNGLTNGSYRVRRLTNDLWRVVAPVELPVDRELVGEFFQLLQGIETGFEKDVVTDFAPYGLTEPARQFSFITVTNGTSLQGPPTLSFGTNLAGGTFARRSDETAVYSVRVGDFDALPLAHWQWRERALWDFTTNEVRRVRIWDRGQTREIIRDAEGRWSLAPGSTGVLTVDLALEEAIHQLGTLKADRWVGVGAPDAFRPLFGFDTNRPHRVAIEYARLGVTRTNVIEFGGVNADGRPFAMVHLEDDQPWFFQFPLTLYHELVLRSLRLPAKP